MQARCCRDVASRKWKLGDSRDEFPSHSMRETGFYLRLAIVSQCNSTRLRVTGGLRDGAASTDTSKPMTWVAEREDRRPAENISFEEATVIEPINTI